MAALTFDKLAYVDRLQAAGMGEREARALAEGLDQALREEVATRNDLAAVRTGLAAEISAVRTGLSAEIAAVRTELKGQIAAVRSDLAAEIAAVRTELKGQIAAVRADLTADIAAVKHDILRWMVGVAFAQVGLTVAITRFLPH
jgi:predicted  nucleic acid-binding Zn-ribbon protein